MSDYTVVPLALLVMRKGGAVFDDGATKVEITDEAAGAFVTVSQSDGHEGVRICADEWPTVRGVIEEQLRVCARLDEDAREAEAARQANEAQREGRSGDDST